MTTMRQLPGMNVDPNSIVATVPVMGVGSTCKDGHPVHQQLDRLVYVANDGAIMADRWQATTEWLGSDFGPSRREFGSESEARAHLSYLTRHHGLTANGTASYGPSGRLERMAARNADGTWRYVNATD